MGCTALWQLSKATGQNVCVVVRSGAAGIEFLPDIRKPGWQERRMVMKR